MVDPFDGRNLFDKDTIGAIVFIVVVLVFMVFV